MHDVLKSWIPYNSLLKQKHLLIEKIWIDVSQSLSIDDRAIRDEIKERLIARKFDEGGRMVS